MLTLNGIPNCDTVRRARAWLDDAGVGYTFHDLKRGLDPAALVGWVDALGWEGVLNRRGLTWRRLPEAARAGLDAERATALMLAHPTAIRRPVLAGEARGRPVLLAGFDPAAYAAALEPA